MFEKYDAYKDSGVEWLGQLPENWDLLPNKHIFKLKKNLVGKRSKEYELLSLTLNGVIKRDMENPEGKFPAEFDTYQEVKSGDFIFCHFDVEETPRTVGLSRFDGMITGAYTVYKVNAEKFCPEFLYYFYLNLDTGKRLKPLYKGLRNTIGKDIFGEFKTFIPNYSEQVKISNFLDQKVTEIDQAIAIKKQQIALLNERKQIVIQKAVTQGLDANVAMKDSGVEWIGEIPEHWNVKPLKFYIAKKIDNRGRTPKFGDAGIPMLEVSNITDGDIYPIEKFEKFVLPEVVQRYERDKVEVGDILISTVGATSGKVVIIKNKPEYFICQNVVGFRMSKEINKQFISYALMSLYFKTSLMLINKGNTIDNLKVSVFVNNKVLVPSLDEQREIVEFIQHKLEEINVVINKYKDQIEKLKEYKTTLINDAVTGKIKVA